MNNGNRLEMARCISGYHINYLMELKTYMRVHSFDELAVVLLVASRTQVSDGVSEKQISDSLGIPRSTANRLLKILIDGRQIVCVEGVGVRKYAVNLDFAVQSYGADGPERRGALYRKIIADLGNLNLSIATNLSHSQYGKPEE